MKKILFATILLATISSCSFMKDVSSHCKPDFVSGNIETGSFDVCLKCDSLAKVVYSNIQKQVSKK